MQTAIHFEDGLAYTCVLDGEKIIEEEPVRFRGSWIDVVFHTARRHKEESLGIVLDDMTPKVRSKIDEGCRQYGIDKENLKFYTKEEAVLGFVKLQKEDLRKGRSVFFDDTKEHFICYEVGSRKGTIVVERQDFTEQMEKAATDHEKDAVFLEIIKRLLAAGPVATVYLSGSGFDSRWFEQSTKLLCRGRRVFMGKHLYACGGAYLSSREILNTHGEEGLILNDTVVVCQIGLVVHHHGRDVFCPLIKEGRPWFESRGTMEIFVSGMNGLVFELRSQSGIKHASVKFLMEGMKKDPQIVYKLRIEGEYTAPDQCKIKVYDLGFGKLRSSTLQVWQQIIHLERGDFHE